MKQLVALTTIVLFSLPAFSQFPWGKIQQNTTFGGYVIGQATVTDKSGADKKADMGVRLIRVYADSKIGDFAFKLQMQLNGNTFGTPDDETPSMHGYADMVLARENGQHVIFDFKWTTSKSYYQGLLKKNRSSQLAIYAELLSELTDDQALPTAYFLMPIGRLYNIIDNQLIKRYKKASVYALDETQKNKIAQVLKNDFRIPQYQINRCLVCGHLG